MENNKDNPGVIAPPPLVFLSGMVLGGILTYFYPFRILPDSLGILFGNLLLLVGIAVIAIVFLQMRKSRTNIEPWKPTTKILDTGFYGYSRNPIYFGMILIYLGATFIANSIWLLPFLPICLLVIHYGVILREERYLEDKFGEDYLEYKKRVRRWI